MSGPRVVTGRPCRCGSVATVWKALGLGSGLAFVPRCDACSSAGSLPIDPMCWAVNWIMVDLDSCQVLHMSQTTDRCGAPAKRWVYGVGPRTPVLPCCVPCFLLLKFDGVVPEFTREEALILEVLES